MAESFGGKMRNVMVTILIGLLVVAFAVWGVNDVFTQRAGNAVISVGKAEVSTDEFEDCLLYTSPSPRDATLSRMPSSA